MTQPSSADESTLRACLVVLVAAVATSTTPAQRQPQLADALAVAQEYLARGVIDRGRLRRAVALMGAAAADARVAVGDLSTPAVR